MEEKLRELANLHQSGVLSDEEFTAGKAKVLNENQGASDSGGTGESPMGKIQDFFKNDILNMTKTFFKEPLSGVQSLLKNQSPNSYFQSLVLFGTTGLAYMIVPYLVAGKARKMFDFGTMIQFGLLPIIFMLLIAGIAFGLKSTSRKADFKTEIFTGALNAFPLLLLLLFTALAVMFGGDNLLKIIQNPVGSMGVVLGVLAYCWLMMINVLTQSLQIHGCRDAMAWYSAPFGVSLAFYLTGVIADGIF